MTENIPDPAQPSRFAYYVRVTQQEYKRIEKMCLATGKSAQELFKSALLGRFDLERPLYAPEDAQQILTELNRHGNNLNQIARKINSGLATGWNQAFNSLTRSYVDLRRIITVNHADR